MAKASKAHDGAGDVTIKLNGLAVADRAFCRRDEGMAPIQADWHDVPHAHIVINLQHNCE